MTDGTDLLLFADARLKWREMQLDCENASRTITGDGELGPDEEAWGLTEIAIAVRGTRESDQYPVDNARAHCVFSFSKLRKVSAEAGELVLELR